MSTTATKPAIESGETSPLTARDAALLAAWYTRYALDRLDEGPRRLHPGVRAHLAAASMAHEAAATALELEHDLLIRNGIGDRCFRG